METKDMLNIRKLDVISEIEKIIFEVKDKYQDLVDYGTCMIYTGEIYDRLKDKGILAYIVDTYEDLNMEYRHQFVVVVKDPENNYVVDLTYGQFGYDETFNEMYEKGYQLLNEEEYEKYLDNIVKVTKKVKK